MEITQKYIARLKSRLVINQKTNCHEWSGCLRLGYGCMSVNTEGKSKSYLCHRIAYHVHHGSIPHGASILHKCDNKKCCNPEHLYAGDARDNVMDMVERNPKWLSLQKKKCKTMASKSRKITGIIAKSILIDRRNGMYVKDIAIKHNLGKTTVVYFLNGNTYKNKFKFL